MLKTPHESIEQHPKGLCWEYPLGTVRGHLNEPDPDFIDPYAEEERVAIQELARKSE